MFVAILTLDWLSVNIIYIFPKEFVNDAFRGLFYTYYLYSSNVVLAPKIKKK